ncbi:MAG TPA: delta-60 repeat domain-containing protein, partial [Pyrinomonadaceae bacterium]
MIYYRAAHVKLLLLTILFLVTTTGVFAAEGELDPTFDGDGIVTTDNNSNDESITDVVIQPDGKILVIGDGFLSGSALQTAIVRYNPDGSLDTTFSGDGKYIVQSVYPGKLALQPDGKIVFVGIIGSSPNRNFFVTRLNSDGNPDPTFNGVGANILDLRGTDDGATSVKIQPDGKIVIGGSSARTTSGTDFALVRLNADGSPDLTFDGDGKVFTSLGQSAGISDIALQPDGKIAATGTASTQEASESQPIETFATVRYHSNGSPDTSFDGDATVFTRFVSTGPFGSLPHNRANSMVVQPDGKILVAGSAGSCCSPLPRDEIAMIR